VTAATKSTFATRVVTRGVDVTVNVTYKHLPTREFACSTVRTTEGGAMATLDDLMAALDDTDGQSTVSSVRQPAALRRALAVAVELGLVSNANEAQTDGLRAHLEALALRAGLEAHYAEHPQLRPSLAEVALALAELEHSALLQEPGLIAQAAVEVVQVRADADADDVLLWAEGLRRYAPVGSPGSPGSPGGHGGQRRRRTA